MNSVSRQAAHTFCAHMPPKSSPAASKTEYAKYLVLVYCVLGHAPFALMSDTMIPEVFPDMKLESCPRRGPCTPTLEATVATIYFEVIFGFVLMFSAVIAIPKRSIAFVTLRVPQSG